MTFKDIPFAIPGMVGVIILGRALRGIRKKQLVVDDKSIRGTGSIRYTLTGKEAVAQGILQVVYGLLLIGISMYILLDLHRAN